MNFFQYSYPASRKKGHTCLCWEQQSSGQRVDTNRTLHIQGQLGNANSGIHREAIFIRTGPID